MIAQRIHDTLRRAEFELVMAGERRLADQVTTIRLGTCALVRAVQSEREANNQQAQCAACAAVTAALAVLNRDPRA